MTDEPFFEPWPEPEDDRGDEERDLDLPWVPPVHVAGVVVPLRPTCTAATTRWCA